MNDPNANPDRARPRTAADVHRHRVMDPADAMVNHVLDLACEGDMDRARAALREARRRDPGFVDRYERTARVLSLLRDGEDGNHAGQSPDLTARILESVEHQRRFVPMPQALGPGRSAIASASLAIMAMLVVMQFRSVDGSGGAASMTLDDSPVLVQAGSLDAGRLQNLLTKAGSLAAFETGDFDWTLPAHAATYDGLSGRASLVHLNTPTAQRPGQRHELFTCVATWRLSPHRAEAMSPGLMGLTEPRTAIEINLGRVLERR
jgi:hypothetical protein